MTTRRRHYFIDQLDSLPPPPPPRTAPPAKERIPKLLAKVGHVQAIFPDISVDVIELLLRENKGNVEQTVNALLAQQAAANAPQHVLRPPPKAPSTSQTLWKKYHQQFYPKDTPTFPALDAASPVPNETPSDPAPVKPLLADTLKINYIHSLVSDVLTRHEVKELYRLLDGSLELIFYVLVEDNPELATRLRHFSDENAEEVRTESEEEEDNSPQLPHVRGLRPGESYTAFVDRTLQAIIPLSNERAALVQQLARCAPNSSNQREFAQRVAELNREVQARQEDVLNVYLRMLLARCGEHASHTLTVDLHGYTQQEAVGMYRQMVACAGATSVARIRFITGVGRHSERNRSVIKERLIAAVRRDGFAFATEPAGVIVTL